MVKRELKSIDMFSAAKVSALLMLLIGGVVGVVMVCIALLLLVIALITGTYALLLGFLGILAFTAVFIGMYVAIGYLSGLLYAAIYNLIAGKWGGIKMDLV